MGFVTEILLDLDQLDHIHQRGNSDLTVDYGEYFKLTIDFHFDRGQRSEYMQTVVECHPLANCQTDGQKPQNLIITFADYFYDDHFLQQQIKAAGLSIDIIGSY